MKMNKTIIRDAQAVVEKFTALHQGEIPEHLMKKDAKRNGKEFDPNSYLTVLTHLTLVHGYTLDYIYNYTFFDGSPYLYARQLDAPPLRSAPCHGDWEVDRQVSDFLVADGSPEGFFELVVFRCLAGQFYLHWHSKYNDLRVITESSEIEALISEFGGEGPWELGEAKIAAMRLVDPQPIVEIDDNRASVSYCIFSKWGGLLRLKQSFRKTAPHLLLNEEQLDEVKYNCGICY